MKIPRSLNSLGLTFLVLGVSGCALLLPPKKDPTRYYVLTGTQQGKIRKDTRSVAVSSVMLPAYLEHKEIVTAGSEGDLKLAEFSLWAEPLDKAIYRVVAENLSYQLDSPVVTPDTTSERSDVLVNLVVRRFEQADDRQVHLIASYTLIGKTETADESKNQYSASREINVPVANSDNPQETANAMSQALDKLSHYIAKDLALVH